MADTKLDIIVEAKDEATSVLTTLREKVSGLAGLAGGALAGGLAAAGAALGAMGVQGVKSVAQFEDFTTQFKVMLGSADAAKERLNQLTEFAVKTPFNLEDVVQADRVIQGFGLHSLDSAKQFGYTGDQILTIAGDVASGTGASFTDIAADIGKFSAGATGEAMRRFMELGVVTRQQLEQMGIQFNKAGSIMSPLPQATQAVLTLMKQKYGGLMDAQSHTLNGMLSNLQDWFHETLRTVSQPIFDKVKTSVSGLLDLLDKPEVQKAIQNFGLALANVAVAIGNFANSTGILQGLFGLFMNIFGPKTTGPLALFNRLMMSNSPVIRDFGQALFNLIRVAQDQLPKMAAQWQQTFQEALAIVQKNFPQILTIITSILNTIAALWEKHGAQIMAVVGFLFKFLVSLIGGALQIILSVVDAVLKVILGIFDFFTAASKGDWQGMSDAIIFIVNALSNLVLAVIQALVNVVTNLFNMQSVNVKATWLDMTTRLDTLTQQLRANAIQVITDMVNKIIAAVRNAVTGMVNAGRDMMNGFWDGLKDVASGIASWVTGFVSSMLAKIRGVLRAHSPSEAMRDIAHDTWAGFQLGGADMQHSTTALMEKSTRGYMAAARSVAAQSTVNNSQKTINIYPTWKHMDDVALRDELRIYEMLTA